MSTEAASSISLKDARPLQTFIAPVEVCPIPLSVLWMPFPDVPEDLWTAVNMAAHRVLSVHPLTSQNPQDAVQYLLEEIIRSEGAYHEFILKAAGRSSDAIKIFYEPGSHSSELKTGNWYYRHGVPPFSVSGDYLFDIPVTINRSPPTEEILGKLLSSCPIALGAYTGLYIVPQEANPFLFLAAVSGGIICISTAAGIGRALQDGLYQRLLSLFESSSKRSEEGSDCDN